MPLDDKDRGTTKDGETKQKTGPKVGSHHQRGRAIKHAKAGKEAISALSGRVAALETEGGHGGVFDPEQHPGGSVPDHVKQKACDFVDAHMSKHGMYFKAKKGNESKAVHSVSKFTVYVYPPNQLGGITKCTPVPVQEFIRWSGLRFDG